VWKDRGKDEKPLSGNRVISNIYSSKDDYGYDDDDDDDDKHNSMKQTF
jgi:hypothetical protein